MIQIQNLHFSYRRQKVFTDLSLQFKPGYVYGLLGKNGTGKSTLLRNIAGLLFPHRGSIQVAGMNPGKREPRFLEDVFMVPEEFHLPDITVDELLRFGAPFYSRFRTDQFQKYCAAFEVPAGSSLQNMSYGQKKKVLISFALATQARFLLMDEPTNGLDITSKSQFRKVLAEALDENRCMIISTHQVKDLENLIDRITVIDEGKILFDEDIETISRKLSFRHVFETQPPADVLYSESSLRGNVVVTPNTEGSESKLDLEILYKAIVQNGDKIKSVFNA